jgi:hypothetical protein
VTEELDSIDASRIVVGVRADLGVVLDRAAERLLLVDELGASVPAELGLLLVVRLLALSGRTGTIAVRLFSACSLRSSCRTTCR